MFPKSEELTPLGIGLLCLAMVAVLVIMIPVTAFFERRRLRRVTARFLHGRAALTDAEFLRRAGAAAHEEAFFLAARRAMAALCGVPAEMIHPEDTWRSLMDLQWDNGYVEDIVFGLERELGRRLPLVFLWDVRRSFTDYVRRLAHCLEQAEACGSEDASAGG